LIHTIKPLDIIKKYYSTEEQIICYADKFFSKNGNLAVKEKSVEDIIRNLEKCGKDKVAKFKSWADLFQ
jgi:uncharacterized protein